MQEKVIIGVLGIIFLVVAVSGCTTSSNEKYPGLRFQPSSPSIDYGPDGTGLISAGLINDGEKTYRNIDVLITGYDQQGNVIIKQNKRIANLEPKGGASVSISLTGREGKVYSAEMNITNATPV